MLTTLVVLVVLAVGADRVALLVAESQVASQLQTSGDLSRRPSVSIRGMPFLTQALSGTYDRVEVSATDVTAGNGKLSSFDATLAGVQVPLSDALSGSVTSVPVDRLTATVLLTYADLQAQLRDRRLSLAPGPDGLLRVTGSVTVLGRTVSASALSSVKLRGTDVVVTARRFEVGARPADRVVTAALGNRLDFTARIGKLPYGLRLTGVTLRPQGVLASATAQNTVLTR
jgi:hypothetical protein